MIIIAILIRSIMTPSFLSGTIQKIQSSTGCRVRVSNNGEFFPGTGDRVVLVTGTPEEVVQGVILVLSELYENAEEIQKNGGQPVDVVMLSVLIPDKASGLIIGRGGENIRAMVEESGSKIQLTAKEKQIPGLDERVLTCTGNLGQVKKALTLVVSKICEDPSANYSNLTTQYQRYLAAAGAGQLGGIGLGAALGRGLGTYGAQPAIHGLTPISSMGLDPYAAQLAAYGGADPFGAGAYGAAFGGVMAGHDQFGNPAAAAGLPTAGGGVTYTLHVPDTVVPAILGRGGAVIREIMEQSGESMLRCWTTDLAI